MSSLHVASNLNVRSPSNTLHANHTRKEHGSAAQTIRTDQDSPSTLHELPLSPKVLRAMRNHTCPAHGRRRAAATGPLPSTIPLTAPTQYCEVPTPPGVVRATNIGSSGAICRHRSRQSIRDSLEEAFDDCQENSVGFLTPSLNQSHSDPPSRDDNDPSEDRIRFLCCYMPKIDLPQLRHRPCLRFSLSRDQPMMVGASSHASHSELFPRAWRKKSASVANDEAMRYVGNRKLVPTTVASSTSVIRGNKIGSLGRSDSTITVCRNALFSRGRQTGTVSEIAMNRNGRLNIRQQMELPTIVTLRRAIAVLNTLAQPRIQAFSADMDNSAMLREYRRSIRSMASPAEYLITSEEIRSLKNQMRSKFIAPAPKQIALVKKKRSLVGMGWKGRVKKSSSRSVVWFGASHKSLQSRAALSISNAHTASGSILSRGRTGHLMSRITQRTSVVSVIMTGKSIHEMIWEEDGRFGYQSRNSFRQDPDPTPIEDRASYSGGTAITGIKRTFKTVWEHPSERDSDTPYDINKSLSLSEVKIQSYVTQQFSICTPKPISEGVWLPPILTFKAPLIEIPAANPRPSVLDPGSPDSIWRENHGALITQPKHPLLGSPVPNSSAKPALAAPATMSQPKPSLWRHSTQSLLRAPVDSRPQPSLWSSDVAASGHMAAASHGRESTAESTPRLWNRASVRRLRTALGMGSGESWRRVMGVENIMDAENTMENPDDRAPWGAETLDDVSIISEGVESEGSWKRDSRSQRGKNKLFGRISQRAGNAREKLFAARKEKDREWAEDGKYNGGDAGGDCPSERAVDQRGSLEERSKYDEMEEWVGGLSEAALILRPLSSKNYTNIYGTSRATDRKVGDDRPLKLEGVTRRSVSITTIA